MLSGLAVFSDYGMRIKSADNELCEFLSVPLEKNMAAHQEQSSVWFLHVRESLNLSAGWQINNFGYKETL